MRNFVEDFVSIRRLAVLGEQGGLEPGQVGTMRILCARLVKPRSGLIVLALFLEREDGEPLGRWASFAGLLESIDPRERSDVITELNVDLSQAHDRGRAGGFAGGDGPVKLGGGLAQVLRGPSGLVELAAEKMEGTRELSRGRSLGDLLEQGGDDGLGLLGIAGLEDRPGCPELILRVQAAEPKGCLQELAAQGLLAGQDQGDSVACLGFGDIGQLTGGELQVLERAGAESRLKLPFGIWSGSSHVASDARAIKVDRSGEEMTQPLILRVGTFQERLDMGSGFVEPVLVFRACKRILDGHRVQAHHRSRPIPARGLRRLECLVDDLEAPHRLTPKPEMVGVRQIGLQIGLLFIRKRQLEDGLELDLDGIDQAIDRFLLPAR